MVAGRFLHEFERLQADALARMNEAHAATTAQLMQDLEALRGEALGALERTAAPTSVGIIPPPVPGVNRTDSTFNAALRQPVITMHVNGVEVHVHRHVLNKIPFFAALIDGTWSDSEAPRVDLPCTVDEFMMILQGLYTGQMLGSQALSVPTFDAALRLGAAVGMLLIDDLFPELLHVLRSTILTKEDVQLAQGALAALPPSLCLGLQDLTDSSNLPTLDLSAIFCGALTEATRPAVSRLLTARRGQIDATDLVGALNSALKVERDNAAVCWLAGLAQEHLCCADATEWFRTFRSASIQCKPRCTGHTSMYDQEHNIKFAAMCSAFAQHLLRCARLGAVAEVIALGVDSRIPTQMCACLVSPVRLTAAHADRLVEVVLASPCERAAIAAQLVKMQPYQLKEVLVDGMVAALGSFVEPLVVQLSTNTHELLQWVTPVRLALMPLASRQAACVELAKCLDRVSSEVAAVVVKALT